MWVSVINFGNNTQQVI